MTRRPGLHQMLHILHSLSTTDRDWIFTIKNIYIELLISKQNSCSFRRQKGYLLNSMDDVFTNEYFMTLSDEFTNKCCSVWQSPRVLYNCPHLVPAPFTTMLYSDASIASNYDYIIFPYIFTWNYAISRLVLEYLVLKIRWHVPPWLLTSH